MDRPSWVAQISAKKLGLNMNSTPEKPATHRLRWSLTWIYAAKQLEFYGSLQYLTTVETLIKVK